MAGCMPLATYLVTNPTPPGQQPAFLAQRGLREIAAIKLERALHIALCFASSQTSLHSRYIPRYRPSPSPGQQPPLFTAAWLAWSSCNQAGAAEARFETALCFASLQTSLHCRYIPRIFAIAWFCVGSCNIFSCMGLRRRALRTALVLKSCDSRAGAAALRRSALHCASDTDACQDMSSRYRGLRYRPP